VAAGSSSGGTQELSGLLSTEEYVFKLG